MNITLLSVDVKTMPTAKGSYQVADVAYKNNTFQGKVEGKKVVSFGKSASAFTTLANASPGETYEVESVKDGQYNVWTSLTKAEAGAPSAAGQTIAATSGYVNKASVPTKTTYETAEERAQRQVLIVRQSSVSSAVAMLCAGAKTPPSLEAVLATAKAFEAYVFGQDSPAADFGEEFPTVD